VITIQNSTPEEGFSTVLNTGNNVPLSMLLHQKTTSKVTVVIVTYSFKLSWQINSIKYSLASSHSEWLNGKKTNILRTQMVLQMLVYLPLNHLMWLLVREYFILL
jgi:hypothetical protein